MMRKILVTITLLFNLLMIKAQNGVYSLSTASIISRDSTYELTEFKTNLNLRIDKTSLNLTFVSETGEEKDSYFNNVSLAMPTWASISSENGVSVLQQTDYYHNIYFIWYDTYSDRINKFMAINSIYYQIIIIE